MPSIIIVALSIVKKGKLGPQRGGEGGRKDWGPLINIIIKYNKYINVTILYTGGLKRHNTTLWWEKDQLKNSLINCS